eukprot:Sspe_Gene.4723::Locus_1554_Transcript_1_1_Confidence_1.000_Length_523::g.4723::m.4723
MEPQGDVSHEAVQDVADSMGTWTEYDPARRTWRRRAAVGGDQLFPNCEIPYEIRRGGAMSSQRARTVEEGIELWRRGIPRINFRPRRNGDRNFITFVGMNGGGGSSPVGMVTGGWGNT